MDFCYWFELSWIPEVCCNLDFFCDRLLMEYLSDVYMNLCVQTCSFVMTCYSRLVQVCVSQYRRVASPCTNGYIYIFIYIQCSSFLDAINTFVSYLYIFPPTGQISVPTSQRIPELCKNLNQIKHLWDVHIYILFVHVASVWWHATVFWCRCLNTVPWSCTANESMDVQCLFRIRSN